MEDLLYVKVAKRVEELIRNGVYQPGDKLPSLRTVHLQQGVSIGTALQAYYHLLDKGVIQARERSGYFVMPLSTGEHALPRSIPLSLSERSVSIDKLMQRLWMGSPARQFVSFANAIPDAQLLPLTSIRRAIQQVLQDPGAKYLSYEAPKGNLTLRKAIAKRGVSWGAVLQADDIIITNGATEAVNLCLRAVTKPGDTVLIQSPCYYGILHSLEYMQLKAVSIPCHAGSGIRIEDLENACHNRNVRACVLVSNFNNPNGACLSSEKKRKIAAFANRAKIPVIEDDLYGDIYFGDKRPDTIHNYDAGGWVLLCSSYSKSLVPGFRLGWCIPGKFGYQVERLKLMASHASPSILQLALCSLLQNGVYDRHLRGFRKELDKNLTRTIGLVAQTFPPGTAFTRPEGGLVLWVELPKHLQAEALQAAAFEKGIAIAPGELFSIAHEFKNYIRISYANAWNKKTESALKALGHLCRSL
jgi:DNA-binding transcriptional MocR family regulator